MAKITCDIETFYAPADGYSLSKMTTEAYIRDPRFQFIGVSVSVDNAPAQWFSGDLAAITEWLRQFPWDTSILVGQNTIFDGAALAWHCGIYPKMYADTMGMFRALYGVTQSASLANMAKFFGLPDKGTEVANAAGLRREQMDPAFLASYGRYCCHDTELTSQIFDLLKPNLPAEELLAIDATVKMYTRPLLELDLELIITEKFKDQQAKAGALQALGVTQEALRSDSVLAELLIAEGVSPPTKTGKQYDAKTKTSKEVEKWAFSKADVEFVDLRDHENPRVAALVEARLENKSSIISSRFERFEAIARRGRLPFPLAYAAAQPTLRWQAAPGQAINLQNLNRGSALRKAIRAPKGWTLYAVDCSQVELRHVMWSSGQADILDDLRHGRDVYIRTGTATFGYEVQKGSPERYVAKKIELSSMYKVGPQKLRNSVRADSRRDGMALPDESEEWFVNAVGTYRRTHGAVVRMWEWLDEVLPTMAAGGTAEYGPIRVFSNAIAMTDGMWMQYPNLRYDSVFGYVYDRRRGRGIVPTRLYSGALLNNYTQRSTRRIVRDGMLRIASVYPVVGQVHDEVIFLAPSTHDPDQVKAWAVAQMSVVPDDMPGLPLAAECGCGDTYYDAK